MCIYNLGILPYELISIKVVRLIILNKCVFCKHKHNLFA